LKANASDNDNLAILESRRKLKDEIALSLVVDEETLGTGTIDFVKAERGDFAVVAEPTDNTLGIAKDFDSVQENRQSDRQPNKTNRP
jgi:acetylornithine deacetylase/succinyl-diaminopimelate desuccinylase-like protein